MSNTKQSKTTILKARTIRTSRDLSEQGQGNDFQERGKAKERTKGEKAPLGKARTWPNPSSSDDKEKSSRSATLLVPNNLKSDRSGRRRKAERETGPL